MEEAALPVHAAKAWTRRVAVDDSGQRMVSDERWTTVDCSDDLEWAVLHYSGAARRAGLSYVGALLCTEDGRWPKSAREEEGLERIRRAFWACDLELFELYGGSFKGSKMWSEEHLSFMDKQPPPLAKIGDVSVTQYRSCV